jgi:glycerol transport system ATP-binding protein
MAALELHDVAHRYGGERAGQPYALKPLDLRFRDGGAYALLGPSGCGKTTLLNILSGLLRPSRGSVQIDGRDVTGAPPEVRNIAQVFQFPVIYDTMTVFENLAFPLRNRGVGRESVRSRVEEIAELLELTSDLTVRASGLSAEMKQRISLGRGLVRKDVAAILLDEPLTVIDPHVKWLLRRKLLQIRVELNVTLIYVTHDQTEALTLADEVLVMSEGTVLQQGTPEQLFERPSHTFVGYFIGSPGMNLLPCRIEGEHAIVAGQALPLGAEALRRGRASSTPLVLGIRPEFVRMHLEKGAAGESALEGVVSEVENLGASSTVYVRVAEQTVAVKLFDEARALEPGTRCFLELPTRRSILYADGHALS